MSNTIKNWTICLVLVTISFFCACSSDEGKTARRFSSLYTGKHNGIGLQLLMEKKTLNDVRKYYLRIAKKEAPYAVQEYLSFKNEPYLSNSISLICNEDTVHPSITNAERSYEAGNEIIYLMVFNKAMTTPCSKKTFVVNNLFYLRDTLVLKL